MPPRSGILDEVLECRRRRRAGIHPSVERGDRLGATRSPGSATVYRLTIEG
jgi:hypothetical protein